MHIYKKTSKFKVISTLIAMLFMSQINLSAQVVTDFVTTWKTDNPGSSNNTSIIIPTTGAGYNYDVDWDNDGTFDEFGLTGNVTHDFITVGTYTIRIQGDFPRIYFDDIGDGEKIISIDQWGNQVWTSMDSAFQGCSNLVGQATDVPDLTSTTNLERMFDSATIFNQDINNWNTSNVTHMSRMFSEAASFNQDIGSWNTANVINMSWMFLEATSFNQDIGSWNIGNVTNAISMLTNANLSITNYDALLMGWQAQAHNNNNNVNFGASSDYCAGEAARTALIANGWWIIDGVLDCSPVPNCTQLTSPSDTQTNVAINTNLTWTAVADATGYRITIGTTSGGTDVLNNVDLGNVTTYNPPSDFAETQTYYVTIIAYNAVGNAVTCTETSFTTETIPTVPNCTQLTSPSDTQTNVAINTNLTWTAVADATGYRITIGTTPMSLS